MRIRKPIKRKSMHKRYLVTYCCIALIPVIVIVFALIVVVDSNHENTARDLYRRAITQISAHVDSIVQEMQGSASHLSSNEYFQTLMETDGRFPDAIATYLATVEANSKLPVDVIFYLVGETVVYTADGPMDYAAYETTMRREADLTMSRFFTRLHNITTMTTWLLEAGNETAVQSKNAFAFSVMAPNTAKRGTLVFIVDIHDIQAVISSYLGLQPDYAYLYAPNYDLVGLYEETEQSEAMRSAILRSSINTIENHTISGERYQVLRYKTDLFGIQIITCVQLDKLYGNVEALHSDVLWIGLLITMLSILVAVLMASYSYRPIRALLNSIDDLDVNEALSEFERIDFHLHTVQSEMIALQERLAMQRPMVRDRLMLRLLRGTLDAGGLEQLQSVCPDIQLGRQPCYVALVASEGKLLMYEQHILEKFDLEGADAHGVYIEEERIFALLVVSLEGVDRRLEQCRQILHLLHEYDLPSLKIGVGNLVQDTQSLPSSYLEAYIALSSHMGARDGSDVYLYAPQQEPSMAEGDSWLLLAGDAATIYLQSLRTVDAGTALSMLDSLLERIMRGSASLLIATYTRFELFSRAMAVCEASVVEAFRSQSTMVDVFSDQERFHSLMVDITNANCTAVEQHRAHTQHETRRMILSVLREHCFGATLSLAELSKLVDYSATYINRCLREETGYSFLQLVSMMRIARAKEELVSTDDRIKDIVGRIGYLDVASFTRKFKEAEGMTPGEYREMNRKPAT